MSSSVEIKILGGGGEVGRIAIQLINLSNKFSILLDYGVMFDEHDKPIFPLHVRPKDLSAIFLTHAHLDHSGALPSLYISYSIPLYTTSLTLELTDIMLKDAIKLSGYYLPYEDEEVKKVVENCIPVNYNEVIEINKDVNVEVLNAGHVPGSAMYLINFFNKTILFTGDFNLQDTNLLEGANLHKVPKDIDIVIMEGTYVLGNHPSREILEHEFIETLKSILENNGVILIPTFTIGRAQEVLLTIVKHKLLDYPIIVDGLARIANSIILNYPQYIKDYQLYKKAIEYCIEVPSDYFRKQIGNEPAIIIAPAGMLKGGPALYYLKKIAKNRKNAIILPSFQAVGTPGFELLSKGKVRIDNIELSIEAKIYWFDFSSHSGCKDLENFIKYFNPSTKILMIHTNTIPALKFVNKLKELYDIDNVHVVQKSGEILIL